MPKSKKNIALDLDEKKRIRKNVFKKRHRDGFKSRKGLAEWWEAQINKQEGCCYYCKTPIELIQELIEAKLLHARKGRGGRGRALELERRVPEDGYIPDNCVLTCCYCNNDKSDFFPEAHYRKFFAKVKRQYFLYLSRKLKSIRKGTKRKAEASSDKRRN